MLRELNLAELLEPPWLGVLSLGHVGPRTVAVMDPLEHDDLIDLGLGAAAPREASWDDVAVVYSLRFGRPFKGFALASLGTHEPAPDLPGFLRNRGPKTRVVLALRPGHLDLVRDGLPHDGSARARLVGDGMVDLRDYATFSLAVSPPPRLSEILTFDPAELFSVAVAAQVA